MNTMSLEDVCKLLKITVQTGRNRLSDQLPMPPSYKIKSSRRRLFDSDKVEDWLKKQSGETTIDNDDFKDKHVVVGRGRPKKSLSTDQK